MAIIRRSGIFSPNLLTRIHRAILMESKDLCSPTSCDSLTRLLSTKYTYCTEPNVNKTNTLLDERDGKPLDLIICKPGPSRPTSGNPKRFFCSDSFSVTHSGYLTFYNSYCRYSTFVSQGKSNTKLIECSCIFTENDVQAGNFQVIENFISAGEQKVLLNEIEGHFKGARYEYDHWDDAIHGYRETEKSRWTEETQTILQRVRDEAFPSEATQLPLVHVLDLAEDGFIKPHVDSVKFCGPTIAGLSLISPSVVKLVEEKDDTHWIKALLPPCSLYIMRNKIRYDYTHEILKDEESIINGERIKRGRRVSVMFRDHPDDAP